MTRGEIWTVSGAGYAGKPRPAAIVQDDRFDAIASDTVCVFTTDASRLPEAAGPATRRGKSAPEAHTDELVRRAPQWLADANAALDAAVADAYGWRADITDDDALADLLRLNGRP